LIEDVENILEEYMYMIGQMKEKEGRLIEILKKGNNQDMYIVGVAQLLSDAAKLRKKLTTLANMYFIIGGIKNGRS
jgi:hypothetical protein